MPACLVFSVRLRRPVVFVLPVVGVGRWTSAWVDPRSRPAGGCFSASTSSSSRLQCVAVLHRFVARRKPWLRPRLRRNCTWRGVRVAPRGATRTSTAPPRLSLSSRCVLLAAAWHSRRAKTGGSRRRRAALPRARGSSAGAARRPGRRAAVGGEGRRGGGPGLSPARATVAVTARAVLQPVLQGASTGRCSDQVELGVGRRRVVMLSWQWWS